jgi:hypothetical protein
MKKNNVDDYDNDNDNDPDKGLDQLLRKLKKNPQLMRELVFNRENVISLLGSKAARRLALGVDAPTYVGATDFLSYVAAPDDGYQIAQCFSSTKALCAKGTMYAVKCAGGTQSGGGKRKSGSGRRK